MKRRSIKTLVLVLSLALILASCIGIAVSAESEGDGTLSIRSKNLSYGGTISIAFAVEANNVDTDQITLDVYTEEPTATSVPAYTVDDYTMYDVHGVSCPVFFTKGIPSKEMTKQIYVQAKAGSGDAAVYSEVERYSVAEYAFDMQYRSKINADFEELGAALLTVGEKIQTLLPYNTENLPSSFRYVSAEDGKIDGKYSAGIFKKGATVALDYAGTEPFFGWEVTYYKADGSVETGYLVDGAEITVGDDHIVAAPADLTATFENGTVLFDNIIYKVNGNSIAAEDNAYLNGATATAPSSQTVVSLADDPIFDNNKVVSINGANGTANQNYMTVYNPKGMRYDKTDCYSSFSGDFYLDTTNSGGSYFFKVNFVANVQLGGFMFVSDGDSFKITQNNSSDGGTSGVMFDDSLDYLGVDLLNNWVNFRFDYHYDGLDSTLTIYINDKCVVKDYVCYYYEKTATADQAAKLVEFTFEKSTLFYLDNISFNTSATAPADPEKTVYDFEDGALPAGITNDASNAYPATVVDDPAGSSDKVLGFKGDGKQMMYITGDSVVTSENKYVFETDLYLVPGRTGIVNYLKFYEGGGCNGANEVFGLNMYYRDGKYSFDTHSGGGHSTTAITSDTVTIPENTWFNFRIEYTLDGSKSAVSIYIDGVAFCESLVTYCSGHTSGGNRLNIGSVRWDAYCHENTQVYFDDISLTPAN